MPTSTIPERDLARCDDAQARFLGILGGLDDRDLRRPSLLPGWTVAHVLAHVARNADSHRRRADAARRHEIVDQYPGGYEGRAADIERGAAQPPAQLVDDVVTSAERLADAWRRVPDDAWAVVSVDVSGRERPLRSLPGRRWQELEVHAVDLRSGYTHRDWPDEFVSSSLPTLRATLPGRLPGGVTPPPPGTVDDRDELAWLYGRVLPPGLPELAPWG